MEGEIWLTDERKKALKEVGLVAMVAVPVLIELGYQIWKYWKNRQVEDENC